MAPSRPRRRPHQRHLAKWVELGTTYARSLPDPGVGRPIAAPLERCAQLLGVDLATVGELAAKVEPYLRADGTRIWSLTQLERQLRPAVYGRRGSGYLDRRWTRTVDG